MVMRLISTQALQPVEYLVDAVERVRHALHLFQFEEQGKLIVARAQQAHRLLPVHGAALTQERKQMLVGLTVVVMHVRRADAVFHDFERRSHALAEIGVADIKDESEVQVRRLKEVPQTLGARKPVRNVLEQNFDAALAGENTQLLERRERGIEFTVAVLLAQHADVLDQIAVRDGLRDFERALDFVHHLETLTLHRLSNGDDGVRPRASPDFVGVHRRMQRVELQLGFTEPVAQLGDLGAIPAVQVLTRAEDLDLRNTGLPHVLEPGDAKTVVHEQVRGEYPVHVQYPLAVPSVRVSAAPSSQPPSHSMAATSPCPSISLTV